MRPSAPATFLLAAFFANACSAPPATPSASSVEQAKAEAAQQLVGEWVPDAFLSCVEEHRSVHACVPQLNDYFGLEVVAASPDTLRLNGFTTHEGLSEVRCVFDTASARFRAVDGSTKELIVIDKDHLELVTEGEKRERFRRAEDPWTAINTILFGPAFVSAKGDTVSFDPKGLVEGIPDMDRFEVLTDHTEGYDDRDILFLYTDERNWDTDAYHFKFAGDTLRLYHMEKVGELQFQQGPLTYELVRMAH